MDAASDNLIPLPAPDFWGPLNRRTNVAVQVADGVIASIRSEGFDVRLSGGDLHFSENGKWRLASRDDKQMLKCRIQEGCAALGDVRVGIVAAAWKRLSEHPGLYQRGVTLERDEPVAPTKDDDPPPFCWPADLDAAKPPRPIHPARRVVLAALDVAPM